MPKRKNKDQPGSWHHVMNRGIAHRTVFESPEDVFFFFSRLEKAVCRREIEIHAFTILSNHFHMLVRSVTGKMSHSMMLIQNQYVRWFNSRRQRDGSLFRGRYKCCSIKSNTHWLSVIRYIDYNAVSARIVEDPSRYHYCSAFHYCGDKSRSPSWLERSIIEREVCRITGQRQFSPHGYRSLFLKKLNTNMKWLVKSRLNTGLFSGHSEADPLDHLVYSAPADIRSWMIRNACLADDTPAGLLLIEPKAILSCIRRFQKKYPDWSVSPGKKNKSGWKILAVGLIRSISGSGLMEISKMVECGEGSVFRYCKDHQYLIKTDDNYANRAVAVVEEVLKKHYDKGRSDFNDAVKVFAQDRLKSS